VSFISLYQDLILKLLCSLIHKLCYFNRNAKYQFNTKYSNNTIAFC